MFRLVGLGLLALCACSASDSRAPPVGGGSNGGSVLSGRQPRPSGDADASMAPDDDGGSGPPVGLRCDNVAAVTGAVDPKPGELDNAATQPDDFAVTRVQTRWVCDPDTLEITLSNGRCPDGGGHELVLSIDPAALEDGTVLGGQNTLAPEPDDMGLRIRYRRPFPLEPAGEWGTCVGSSGTVDFLGEPSAAARAVIQARIVADLTACGDDAGVLTMSVQATLQALVPTTLEAACP